MAQSKNNPLTKGASGMIGKTFVFRSWNGKTYISNRPSKPRFESTLQKENRTKFSRAVAFSKKKMADPAKRAEYQQIAKELSLPNAYTAAVTEYMRKPEIESVEVLSSSESTQQEITVKANKKGYSITEVEVILFATDGKIVEGGMAERSTGNNWIYIPKKADQVTFQLLIRVKDRTNNVVEKRI